MSEQKNIDIDKLRIFISEYLMLNGISRSEFSRDLGKGRTYITNILTDGSNISINALKDICDLMGQPVESFLLNAPTMITEPIPPKESEVVQTSGNLDDVIHLLQETNNLLKEMISMWRYE